MVSTSKILTVSYGTFSCTLEGFDNSFDTMKAISEYFRDLAQDDRYFGAEPPTPDAEMLARIAEREIARRVDARVQDGSVVLRPSLGHAAGAATGHASAAQAQTTPAATPETAESPAPARAAATPAADHTLAKAAEASGSFPPAEDSAAPETPADAGVDAPALPPAADTGRLAGLAAASGAVPPEANDSRNAPASPVEEAMAAPEDGVSEKLRRIRAVVGTSAVSPPVAAPETERDEGAPAPDTHSDADAAEDKADDPVDNVFSDSIAAIMADSLTEETPSADADASTGDTNTETEEVPQTAPDAARVRVMKVKQAEFDAALAAGTLEPMEDENAEARSEESSLAGSSLSDEDEEDLARELAALEAELAGDKDDGAAAADPMDPFEDEKDAQDLHGPAEDASPEADEVRADDHEDGQERAAPDDDEEEIADAFERELDAAFSDLGFDTDTDGEDEETAAPDTAAQAPDSEAETGKDELGQARRAVKLANPGRAMLTETPVEEDEGAVSRLMSEADREFEEPEGNRRRSAIAHLRAAVAATRADRLLGRRRDDARAAEPYREDLASVVRPRRPQPAAEDTAAASRPARPAPARPAPLKLVAEQRVDAETDPTAAREEHPAETVRPRRIRRSTIENAAPSQATPGQSFADYADSVGARALPDLLEAAAAYMSFVEERPQFSRPQLMTKLREAEPAESSREDRLRSFGQLLREGKIAKLEGGRFTASDRIGFKPKRAAG